MSAICTTAAVDAPTGSSGALSKQRGTSALPFFVAGVASGYKHVHEGSHRLSPGPVEGVDAAVVTADIRIESL